MCDGSIGMWYHAAGAVWLWGRWCVNRDIVGTVNAETHGGVNTQRTHEQCTPARPHVDVIRSLKIDRLLLNLPGC